MDLLDRLVTFIKIFYDEKLIGSGYVIYEPKTKNFFKIYYICENGKPLEINLLAHTEKLQTNQYLNDDFQSIVFNISEDDFLYGVIKKAHDIIGSNQIASKKASKAFYSCFKIEKISNGKNSNLFRIIFFKKKIVKLNNFNLTADIIIAPEMSQGLMQLFNDLNSCSLCPLNEATFLTEFDNEEKVEKVAYIR